jgi:aryl-alcohol dehydrogenase-like predicted oxidoreductase
MEYRKFGNSGLMVPALSFGTATFSGKGMFDSWGNTDVNQATRLIDICLDNGINFFDTADGYSFGESEIILGKAVKNKRDKVLISSKAFFPLTPEINEMGTSRHHLIKACNDSLTRLGTDYIDMYFMHQFDSITPIEETLNTLNTLINSGKVRYIGCSNFTGWQLMKSLSISERLYFSKYIVYQGFYSLCCRDLELEIIPLAFDQKIGIMVWSPLGWGRLTGKIRRNQELAEGRIKNGGGDDRGPTISNDYIYNLVDAIDQIALETGKTVAQIAINWLLQRPTVCNVTIGARNEKQLLENIQAIGWYLTPEQMNKLDQISQVNNIYPYWHQKKFPERVKLPI